MTRLRERHQDSPLQDQVAGNAAGSTSRCNWKVVYQAGFAQAPSHAITRTVFSESMGPPIVVVLHHHHHDHHHHHRRRRRRHHHHHHHHHHLFRENGRKPELSILRSQLGPQLSEPGGVGLSIMSTPTKIIMVPSLRARLGKRQGESTSFVSSCGNF